LLLGSPRRELVYNMLEAIVRANAKATLTAYDDLLNGGIAAELIHAEVIEAAQNLIRIQLGVDTVGSKHTADLADRLSSDNLVVIVNKLSSIHKDSIAFTQLLQAVLIELSLSSAQTEYKKLNFVKTYELSKKIPVSHETKDEEQNKSISKTTVKSRVQAKNNLNEDTWIRVLSSIKQKNPSLFGLLKTAETEFSKKELKLKFKFQFHLKRFQEAKNLELLHSAMYSIVGQRININLILSSKQNTSQNYETKEFKNQEISNVLQTLGGEIVNGK